MGQFKMADMLRPVDQCRMKERVAALFKKLPPARTPRDRMAALRDIMREGQTAEERGVAAAGLAVVLANHLSSDEEAVREMKEALFSSLWRYETEEKELRVSEVTGRGLLYLLLSLAKVLGDREKRERETIGCEAMTVFHYYNFIVKAGDFYNKHAEETSVVLCDFLKLTRRGQQIAFLDLGKEQSGNATPVLQMFSEFIQCPEVQLPDMAVHKLKGTKFEGRNPT